MNVFLQCCVPRHAPSAASTPRGWHCPSSPELVTRMPDPLCEIGRTRHRRLGTGAVRRSHEGGSRSPLRAGARPPSRVTAIEWSRLSETGWSPAERRTFKGSGSRVSGSDCSHASRQALIPPANHGVERGRQSVIRHTQKGRRRTPKCKKHLKTQIYCRRNSTWRRHYFRNKRRSRPLCVRIVRPARSQAPPSRQDVRRIFRLEFWFPDKAMIDEHSP